MTVHIGIPVGSMRAHDDAYRTVRDGCLTVDLDHLLTNDLASGEMSVPTILDLPRAGSLEPIAGSAGRLLSYQPAVGYQGKDFLPMRSQTPWLKVVAPRTWLPSCWISEVREPRRSRAGCPSRPCRGCRNGQLGGFQRPRHDSHPGCGSLELIGVLYTGGQATVTHHSNGQRPIPPSGRLDSW